MARPLETLTTRTLLGIRFWDPATDRQISDGLQLVAWPETAPDCKIDAFRTASGNFAFQNLPGMRAYEYPVNDDPLLTSPLAQRPFGGMGIHMMREFLDELTYKATTDGRNQLTLVKHQAF